MVKKVKNKKRKLSIYKISAIILFIVSLVFCMMIYLLDVLPLKYFALVLLGMFIIDVPIEFILFRKKSKKKKKNIAFGFSILFIILLILPMIYMWRTLSFVWNIGDTDYKIEKYSVIVLKDSKYKKINDIKGIPVGVYENTSGIKDAKKSLLDEVDVTFENYDNIENISNDLLEKKIDVIFVEDSILSMINEDNEDFSNNIRILKSFEIKIKSKKVAKDVNVIDEPFNIYITGIDTFGDISSVSRSDVNIVMTVNPKTKQVLLTSIPRDYYVELHGKKGSRDKLTHAGIYGTDMSISTIEDLLGIEINYYIKVNFSSFIDIVNALDGIEAYSKYSFTSMDGFKYVEGFNKMNGEEALSFARERKAFVEGDRQRGMDQQAVIEAMIKKICSKTILTKYDSLLDSIDGEFQTNMSHQKITSLIKMQLDDMANWNVTSISLDGSNGSEFTYTGGKQKLYVMIPDWNTVDEASSTIKAVLDGKVIDESFKPDVSKSTRVVKSYSSSSSNEKEEVKSNKVKDNEQIKNDDKKISDKNEIIESSSSEEEINEVEVKIDKTANDKVDDDIKEKKEEIDDSKSNEGNDKDVLDDNKENDEIIEDENSNLEKSNSNE